MTGCTAYRRVLFLLHISPRRFGEFSAEFSNSSLGSYAINQKPKDFDPPIWSRGCASNTEEARRRQFTRRAWQTIVQSFCIEPACVGPVTHVCPPFPQVICRAQADLFRGSGRSRTFFRTTSTTSRGASGMRHGGPNRHPCSCHALRHPTGRHPSLTHPLWVPRACWTGTFGRRSS